MLTMVEVYTAQGETLALPLQDISNGYVVKDVEGLDPVKATLVSSRFAQMDGAQFQASRRETRNIIMTLGLEPDYSAMTVRGLRNYLYNILMPKSSVTLRFYLDGVAVADIDGRVESFETPHFSQDPEVKISLLCFDPDFYAPVSTVVSGSTVTGTVEQVVEYPGTVETGFLFRLLVNRSLSEFILYNVPRSNENHFLEFATPLVAGDVLEISTISGSKGATLTRAGSDSSVLYGVSPVSNWLNLFPGENKFRAVVSGAAIPYEIEYVAKYGGL